MFIKEVALMKVLIIMVAEEGKNLRQFFFMIWYIVLASIMNICLALFLLLGNLQKIRVL